jgi:glycosyltransferase involved in cell wall biosynthesis
MVAVARAETAGRAVVVPACDQPGVTVIIPTIPGRQALLRRALDSVWAQTAPPAAVVVVRDQHGRGAWWARNAALGMTATEWLAWLDDDDELLPAHLELLTEAAAWSRADLVYSYPEFVGCRDPLAAPAGGQLRSPLGLPFGPEQARHLRQVGNFIPVCYLARTLLVRAVGGMPRPFSQEWPRCCEDWGLLVRLLDAGARFHHHPDVTWRYYAHPGNTGGLLAELEAGR